MKNGGEPGSRAAADGTDRAASFRQYLTKRWSPTAEPILVVGDSMLDIYVFGTVERISPEAPVPIMRQQQTREAAGGAANAAVNIAGLGGSAHLVSCIGADADGDRLAAVLVAAGVTSDLVRSSAKPTTVKTRFSVGQHQILRLDREDPSTVTAECEREILAAIERRIGSCRLVVLSDYDKGMLTDRILSQTIAWARERGVPVVVDPKRRDFSAYRGATYIKPNLAELERATGLLVASSDDGAVEHAAGIVAAATEANVLVTRSEAGMSLVLPGGPSIHMSTHAHEVFDVTGAGDTVIAAFALGLASDHSTAEAMAFANLAAGIAVSKPGTTVVLADEVEAERSLLADGEVAARGALVTLEMAMRLRRIWKHQGLAVGFTNGCFDLLHPGHVQLLRQAAHGCDRLILGLNSDASVRRLKGVGRPVQTEDSRAAVLGAIEHVNLVVVFDEDTPAALIDLLVPDLLVKGADYRIEDIVGADTVLKAGGRVITVDLVPGQSTTKLVAAGHPDKVDDKVNGRVDA
ncbi:MAG: hypothetical protein JWQ58_1407 [Reyranella sp.]|nr:hypothetical protein [Reyranella sp.]